MGLTAFQRMRREAEAKAKEKTANGDLRENAGDLEAETVCQSPGAEGGALNGDGENRPALAEAVPAPEPDPEPEPEPGISENRLKQMNKEKLAEYGTSLGLSLSPDELKKDEMIGVIQKREIELER
jgi:hypothetical protein